MRWICSGPIALGLGFLGMSACAIKTDSPAAAAQADAARLPVLVRQSVRNEQTLQALFMGRLHLDTQGCLRGDNDAGPIIIWHHDTRMVRAPDGRIRIVDIATGNGVYVGDDIALSGGYRTAPATNVTEPVPGSCLPQSRFFVAGRVMSEDQREDIMRRQHNRPIAPSASTKTVEPRRADPALYGSNTSHRVERA
jgi:hypothetical protein